METLPKTKRKLLLTGKYTYMVTLPKEWVRHLEWRSKQMLELELMEKGIRIRDFPNEPRTKGKR